jgi:hypothetical protein
MALVNDSGFSLALRCPVCRAGTRVINSRGRETGDEIYRRRECEKGHRFSTEEKAFDPRDYPSDAALVTKAHALLAELVRRSKEDAS